MTPTQGIVWELVDNTLTYYILGDPHNSFRTNREPYEEDDFKKAGCIRITEEQAVLLKLTDGKVKINDEHSK